MSIPQTGNNTPTQAERLGAELLKLKADVTAQDRIDAQAELSRTKATVSKYLNGTVLDNDMAVKMIEFFKKKIAARDEKVFETETDKANA